MADIKGAVQTVKDLLREGSSEADAIAETAAEFGVTRDHLLNRFIRMHDGRTPSAWLVEQRKLDTVRDNLAKASQDVAVAKARQIALHEWRAEGNAATIAGGLFVIHNREYAFVVYGADNPAHAIRAIDVQTHRLVNFPAHHARKILSQVAPGLQLAA